MGFTIEDMVTETGDKYKMRMLAGRNGWSNSISWILMIEDMTILENFKGKDLAVTTGLGFRSEKKLLALVNRLVQLGASGLIINTGQYIHEVPPSVIACCDEYDLPLLTVPWDVLLFDMIKDLNIRVLLQGTADEQITQLLIRAIEHPESSEEIRKDLLPWFDVDGTFQIFLLDTGDLDVMDTVERRRISFQLQIYLESISHNACFFYYDSCFVTVTNAIPQDYLTDVLTRFVRRAQARMPEKDVFVGVGSPMQDVRSLHNAYMRAKAAVQKALRTGESIVWFDRMGNDRLLSMIEDAQLRSELGTELLRPLLDYDARHEGDYIRTLELYLMYGGSIKEVSERTYTHRNTVIYRIGSIKKLLGSDLSDPEDQLKYRLACILHRISDAGERH